MGELMLGCSGWNYGDTPDKDGWSGAFYPDKETRRLRYYSQFFNTAEMDSSFYEKFYSQMTKGTFIGMTRVTPENFSVFYCDNYRYPYSFMGTMYNTSMKRTTQDAH